MHQTPLHELWASNGKEASSSSFLQPPISYYIILFTSALWLLLQSFDGGRTEISFDEDAFVQLLIVTLNDHALTLQSTLSDFLRLPIPELEVFQLSFLDSEDHIMEKERFFLVFPVYGKWIYPWLSCPNQKKVLRIQIRWKSLQRQPTVTISVLKQP